MASISRAASTSSCYSQVSVDWRDRRRHEKYYWEDGNVVFLVEDTLFRVHRYLFEQSPVFHAMFSLPPPVGSSVEGATDSNPVRLGAVSATAFEHLLWYMYPGFHGDLTAIPADGWVHILDMATMFDFERIRSSAINVLSRCPDPMFKLSIAERFHVDEWRLTCYAELCMRPRFFTSSEMRLMGPETTARLVRARELVRSHLFRRAHGQGTTWPCPNGKESKKNGCAERVATATCEVLLKESDSSTTLVQVLYGILGPKQDRQLRENGLCAYCALQWDKAVADWLGVSEIRKILKGVFPRHAVDHHHKGEPTPVCGLPIATLPREDDRQMQMIAAA